MSKTTAVEYLIKVLEVNAGIKVSKHLEEEFLQMEKEQIKEAYMSALPYGLEYSHYDKYANKYYNEVYKKEDK
jgi:hypothetical protein